MELYGKILNFAMPSFLFLVLLEKAYGWLKFKHPFNTPDTLSSLASGITNVLKDVLGLSITIISYPYLLEKFGIFKIESTWVVYAIAFIVLDFTGYVVHRMAHAINFFWNKHAIHHSSEEFNLACALRQSIATFVNLFTFFLIPAAIFGVPKEVISLVAPIHLFAQFWYHTTYIKKMGFLEKFLVTPSHHRVHHAINPEYIDKNHGQIFIFWDKLFGTFQAELDHVPAVYGITRPVATWNPIKINFQHLWLLIKDAAATKNLEDKLTLWFKPTGWRPADIEQTMPVRKIEDVYNFEKYKTKTTWALNAWSWVQFLSTYGLVAYLFANLGSGSILTEQKLIYGVFIFVAVYAFTEVMDNNPQGWLWEVLKAGLGLYLLSKNSGWFGMDGLASTTLMIYFLVSPLVALYFCRFDRSLATQNFSIV
jgi:alkylglycerol monooxygenase